MKAGLSNNLAIGKPSFVDVYGRQGLYKPTLSGLGLVGFVANNVCALGEHNCWFGEHGRLRGKIVGLGLETGRQGRNAFENLPLIGTKT